MGSSVGKGSIEDDPVEQTLMSGMLLYQSIVFGNKFTTEDADAQSSKVLARNEHAGLLHIFTKDRVLQHVLEVGDIEMSVRRSPDSVRWFHVSSMTVLAELMNKLGIHSKSAMEIFCDKTFRNRDKVTEDGAILLSVISVCLHDKLICGKKMVLYQKGKLLISLEHQLMSTVKSSLPEDGTLQYNMSSFFSSFIPLNDGQSQAPSNPIMEKARSESVVGPKKGDDRATVINTEEGNGLGVSLLENEEHRFSNSDSMMYRYSDCISAGAVLTDLMERCTEPEFRALVETHGSNYITCNILKSMQGTAHPVVRFLTRSQLELHETVFVRKGMPTHSAVETLQERADTIDHVIKLIRLVCSDGTRGLELMLSQFTESMGYVRVLLTDIIDENNYAIETMALAQQELKVLTKQLDHFDYEQNQRVSLLFSIVTTIFLPMTFIAGVFGMNFSDGGALVHVLERKDGTNVFYFLCLVSIITVMLAMQSYGILDMFVKRKWNRFIGAKDRLQRKMSENVNYASLTARDIVNQRNSRSRSTGSSTVSEHTRNDSKWRSPSTASKVSRS